jgi:hypothetical protein
MPPWRLLVCATLLAGRALAQPMPELTGRVVDRAELLDSQAERE